MAFAFAAQDGGGLFDLHRNGDVHDLRRRVPVLPWQEFDRAISKPGVGNTDSIDNLFAREQLDDRLCRTCSAAREPRRISILVVDNDRPGCRISGGDGH